MQDTKTFSEMADSLGSVAQDTGKQQMRLRVLKWLYRHKDELPQKMVDSLVDEVSK